MMIGARKLWVSATALTCAVVSCAMVVTAAQPARASTTCVPTMLIGVHGTGEETGVIGNELSSLYNGVVGHTGLPEQGLSGWSDDSTLIDQLIASAGDPVVLAGIVATLQITVNAGETDLYNQVTSEESQCPGERFIIAGFSQGAMVVDQFARDHPGLAATVAGGSVSGIILWADPEFNGNDQLSKGAVPGASSFTSTGGWWGVVGSVYQQRYVYPSAWSGLLHSYCTTLDGVCNWTPDNIPNLLTDHGDENQVPIITDSEKAIEDPTSGWAPSVWDSGSATFYSKWQALSGRSGTLGQPSADPVNKPSGGVIQSFAGSTCGSGSAILWSPSSGTHAMWGCLYNAYLHQYGGPDGTYGYPTTDEESTHGGRGRVNHMSGTYCGTVAGSGLFYSSAGTFPVHGCIYQRYEQIGEDSSGIGLPTSDEYAVSGGVEQNFSNGYIRDISGSITVTVFSSTGLDNTDPYATGCASSAHPEKTVASTTDGPTDIYLRWSGFCGTNWTRVIPNVTSVSGSIEMAIWVERQESNGSITYGDTYYFYPNGTVPFWSDQLYSPVLHARACENYWNRYTKVWSTPVCTGWV